MHKFVTDAILTQIKLLGKDPLQCELLICGLAFKGDPETGDIRNSSALEVWQLLKPKVKKLFGFDPVASFDELRKHHIDPVSIPQGFNNMDAILFLNNHKSFEKIDIFDMVRAMNKHPIVFDSWNQFYDEDILNARESVYMGLSFVKSSIIKL